MEPMKNLCGLIPKSLHKRLMEGKSPEMTNGEYLTKILTTYLDQPATAKQEQRTLAVQISDDMFQRLKSYLDAHAPLTQKGTGSEPFESGTGISGNMARNRSRVRSFRTTERTDAGHCYARISFPTALSSMWRAHNGVSKRVFVVGLVAQELQSWLMEQSPDEVQDQEFGPDQDEQGFGMSMTM